MRIHFSMQNLPDRIINLIASLCLIFGLSHPMMTLWDIPLRTLLVFFGVVLLLIELIHCTLEKHFNPALFPFYLFLTWIAVSTMLSLSISIPSMDCLLVLAGLLLLARRSSISRALPMVLLILMGLVPLIPYSQSTAPLLTSVQDYLFQHAESTESRTPFSLTDTGYQPYGDTRLGGTVSPLDLPVMQVKTSSRTLLRGVVRDVYTGAAWSNTLSGLRYGLHDWRYRAYVRDLFDQDHPDKAFLTRLPSSQTITVTLLNEARSSLFVTQRFQNLKAENIPIFFSPSSEIFSTKALPENTTYTFSAFLWDSDTPGIREVVLDAEVYEADTEAVASRYLQLPEGIEPDVMALAAELSAGTDNAFDRADAICQYLRTTIPYSLTQNEPPIGRDFVSWFLTEEKRGSCTSFASAMTVLARICGLPARYVEGFVALPDANGIANITDKQAHAWVEIYFSGFGWLPFDPTPGQIRIDDEDEQTSPPPSPSPSPTPSPSPSPTPSPTPKHDDPSVTPTPSFAPHLSPTPPPQPEDENKPPVLLPFLLFLLLLLLLIALIVLRLWFTSPERMITKHHAPNTHLYIWYCAICQILSCIGVLQETGEPPASYLARAQIQTGISLDALADRLYASRYARKKLHSSDVEMAHTCYRLLLKKLTFVQRMKLIAKRIKHRLPIQH